MSGTLNRMIRPRRQGTIYQARYLQRKVLLRFGANQFLTALVFIGLLCSPGALPAQSNKFDITLDAREVSRGLLRASMSFDVDPGPFTLQYPKWVPGEHGPTGPVRDMVDLHMSANGKELNWQRDPRDLYTFRTTIPPGAKTLQVDLNFLLPSEQKGFSAGRSSTEQLAVLSWHYVLLYPTRKPAAQFQVQPKLMLPLGWSFGTALRQNGSTDAHSQLIEFKTVPLITLIDSPVLAGRNLRHYKLTGHPVEFQLHIAADFESSLESAADTKSIFERIVEEELALFGSHPFDKYDFLVALSDHIALFGLEHHESSDNRLVEKMLLTEGGRRGAAGMLAHELVHSWNGKARRPETMITSDFQQPQDTELLWVYEGLTDYLESVIPVRAGLWSEADWRDHLANIAANEAIDAGRAWRSLADTSISAQVQFDAPAAGSDRRRSIDFYDEGSLVWLEADVTIRSLTEGRKSLNDFCREFFGKPAADIRTPKVSGYGYKDLIDALDEIAHYDWDGFFRARVYSTSRQAPVGGIEKAGWRLAFRDEFPQRYKPYEESSGYSDFRHSLGLTVHREDDKKVRIEEVLVDSPAYKAGLIAGTEIVAVNGSDFTPDVLRSAIRAAKNSSSPIEILVERDDQFSTVRVDYHGGERYPYLEQAESGPDILQEITRSLAH